MTLSPPTVALRDVLQRNGFRTLGLPGEATWSEIVHAADRLRGRSWIRHRTNWDLPWLGPVRREVGDVDAALDRLAEPDLRLLDRMFWFHDRDAETAVGYLAPGSILNALEGWAATALPVARHDAAVVALVAASSLDAGMDDIALWRRTVREWTDLIENEGYWLAFMKAELAGGFERLASLGDVRDLRESALGCVTDLVISGAREMLIAGKPGQAIRAVEMLRDELPPEAFDEMCGDVARVLGVGALAARKEPLPPARTEFLPHAASDDSTPWWVPRDEQAIPEATSSEAPYVAAASASEPASEPRIITVEPIESPAKVEPVRDAPSDDRTPWWASREEHAKPAASPASPHLEAEPALEPPGEPQSVSENLQPAAVEAPVEPIEPHAQDSPTVEPMEPPAQARSGHHAPSYDAMPWWGSPEEHARPAAAVPAAPRVEAEPVSEPPPAIEPQTASEDHQPPVAEPTVETIESGAQVEPVPPAPRTDPMPWWASREDPPKAVAHIEAPSVEVAPVPEPVIERQAIEPPPPWTQRSTAAEPPPAPWTQRPAAAEPPAAPWASRPAAVKPPMAPPHDRLRGVERGAVFQPKEQQTSEPPRVVEPPAARVEPPAVRVVEPPAARVEPPAARVEPPAACVEPPAARVEPPAARVMEPPAQWKKPIAAAAVGTVPTAARAQSRPSPADAKSKVDTAAAVAHEVQPAVAHEAERDMHDVEPGAMRRFAARGLAAALSPSFLQKAGVGLLAVGIGLVPFLLLLSFADGSSGDAGQSAAGPAENSAWVIESRIELNDEAIGKLLVQRAEVDRVRDSLQQDLAESRSLLAEYQRRINQGLPHDPVAYLRLQRYHSATEARYQQVLEESQDLNERYELRLRRRERLVAEQNQVAVR
ncbi:MAG: hypothetical protein ABR527_04555 [Gemmatimonadota bacterium]